MINLKAPQDQILVVLLLLLILVIVRLLWTCFLNFYSAAKMFEDPSLMENTFYCSLSVFISNTIWTKWIFLLPFTMNSKVGIKNENKSLTHSCIDCTPLLTVPERKNDRITKNSSFVSVPMYSLRKNAMS